LIQTTASVSLWLHMYLLLFYIHEGKTGEENNGDVVFKGNI
jgi:hypothetical protein